MNALARGASDEAISYFKQAYELEPTYTQARMQYATALIRAQRYAEAEELLAPLVEAGTMDIESRLTLTGAYYTAGNRARAIEVLEQLKRDMPNTAAQADALIEQVRAGTVQ